jgi:DNA-binding transcriptional ArsR family regulator
MNPDTAPISPEAEILRALQVIPAPGGIVEVRALNPWTASGYFDEQHREEAADRIAALDAAATYDGIYIVLNEINPALLSRRSNRIETRLPKAAATTADADIIRRRWFPVDIDVKRPSGISSTEEEHRIALEAAGRIAGYLSEVCGFPEPVRADSGNGAHLLYRVDLPNDEESGTLVKRCLQALGAMFDRVPGEDRPGYEVDQTTFNPARIWKLYGTVARKGDHTQERPHRRARILEMPDAIEVVTPAALATLAAQAPEEEQTRQPVRQRFNGSGPGIDLEEWLREYGASLPAYQAKSSPGMRSFYVFDVCPWDSSHRDRSAFMGQRTDGPLVAGCHHNGCNGRTWQDLRDLVEPKRPKSAPAKTPPEPRPAAPAPVQGVEAVPKPSAPIEAPTICTTGAAIHEMTEAALAVVNRWNGPRPELFARSACLVRAALDEKQGLYIQEIDEAGLTGILDRLVVWYRILKGGEERPTHPPREVVRDILALPAAAWRVPHLAGVTATPIFHPDGTIHTTPGYDEETGLYYAPADGFALAPVPEVPTREDVAAALKAIEEVFVDFPFCSPADRANAIGALLTAVLRPCIAGPVPLYLTDKPQAGSGAGLLQRVIGWIAEGREPALKTMPTGPEMRKEIFAGLKNGTRIQIFDNLEDRLSSPELAAALTAVEMTGRILGQTEERTYAVRTFWMANGNNVTVGGDLARRTFKSRVDPQDPMPWQREGFRHPDLIRWVQEARGRILAAVFTLARAWIQAGRPAPVRVPRVGSFEAWRDMIGGILESAGVPDFMGNASEVYLAADEDRVQWENFLQALWNRYGCEPFQPGRVAELLTSQDPAGFPIADSLPDALAEAFHYRRKTFSQVLGMAFKKVDGRRFPGGWCVRQGKWSRGVRTWVVTYAPPTPTPEVVQPWCNLDSSKFGADCQTEEPSSPVRQNGVSGVTCTLPTRKKKSSYKTVMDSGNIPDTNVCAIGSGRLHYLHHDPSKKCESEPDTESEQYPAVPRLHPGYTTPTELPPPPPGTLKHPIDRYERRKYDGSIVCMVPGCKRPAAYGCGAGFPLCEGHYLAEVERVRRDGGRPA